ncbi:large conductance mechanosensitive channel protein MscL [Wansuia hejianensis]|uniref:Large-conductance mechanosensitive channel n=1 Tax=Wansuia hejianensis TaxID=2763667 RepID=A0A926EZD9_9FIRM|nr:large conductance mechanosensitive channel protein MscL [Wansuia hejianensis]MBC8591215.1 large conductance mechanosensitive channel protein MscL [Wansuia hejianensis]
MLKDFKEFAMKGNVVDLAVGVVIGGAFGKIVTSLVEDIIMPLVGRLIGGIDFTNLFITLDGANYSTLAEAQKAGAPTLNYGLFLGSVIDFLIIAFSIFIVIRQINRFKKKEDVVEKPTTKACPYCITQIPIDAIRCPNCTSELK